MTGHRELGTFVFSWWIDSCHGDEITLLSPGGACFKAKVTSFYGRIVDPSVFLWLSVCVNLFSFVLLSTILYPYF